MDYYNGNGPGLGTLTTPRRNNYFYGKLMDELHFRMEQNYVNRKRWLLNRLSLGQGVLCGLTVGSQNGQLWVTPGVAIDALGREIIVPTSQYLDPWILTDACGQAGEPLSRTEAHQVHICLAYRECTADPMPVLVADCNTQEQCAPGTIMESFCLLVQAGAPDEPAVNEQLCEVLTATAESTGPEITLADRRRSLCEVTLGECMTPPERPCVCLASIQLQPDGTIGEIDSCSCRTVVYSNTMLLELILCLAERIEECCGTPPTTTSKVLQIKSGNNQTALINEAVLQPLEVEVLQNGIPLAEEMVTFEIVLGNGQIGKSSDPNDLEPTFSAPSGPDGVVTLPVWVLGSNAGPQQIHASISDGMPGEVFFDAMALDLPVVNAIWPPNATQLTDNNEWIDSWRKEAHLEITFNREMAENQLNEPDSWLRLWEVRRAGNQSRVRNISITYAGSRESILGAEGKTEVYRAEGILPIGSEPVRYLVQIRAEGDNIEDTSTPPFLLDAEFQGTNLQIALLDQIWAVFNGGVDTILGVWGALVDTGITLPKSGDGVAGGRFHSWFEIKRPEI